SVPKVTGSAQVGYVLTASPGTWSGTQPIEYTYQWQRNAGAGWTDIPGATGNSYTPAKADTAMTLRVVVSADNDAPGQVTATSEATAAVRAGVIAGPTPTPVSINPTGAQGNGSALGPSISEDGRYIAFSSDANDLVPGDTNGTRDVFVRDTQTDATTRVS